MEHVFDFYIFVYQNLYVFVSVARLCLAANKFLDEYETRANFLSRVIISVEQCALQVVILLLFIVP